MIPLWMYLLVAAAMFCIGVYGVLSRRNAVAILMSVELMLSAVNINLIAFWRYTAPSDMAGQVFTSFVFVIAAAEAAVGLAIIISIYRSRRSVAVEDVNLLKG
ncbi:MAG: NADH-quinone oxidoreductase subunit NuoK [Chloroflexota bacterium]|nr:NADH-quinone oxidoreductase subunit NuoK [Chloroflexota bacterium]